MFVSCNFIYVVTSHHRRVYARQFRWAFYPSGFVPRLLLRLVHLRLRPLKCWLDAAVIMNRDGNEFAFFQISKIEETDDDAVYELKVLL